MNLLIIYLILIAVVFNLCKGLIHGKLYHKGIVRTERRIGMAELNAALDRATTYEDIRQIRRCKLFYIISLFAFWSFLLLIVILLFF